MRRRRYLARRTKRWPGSSRAHGKYGLASPQLQMVIRDEEPDVAGVNGGDAVIVTTNPGAAFSIHTDGPDGSGRRRPGPSLALLTRLVAGATSGQCPSASATAPATRSIWSVRNSAHIGSDRTSSAARSAAGKSPRL